MTRRHRASDVDAQATTTPIVVSPRSVAARSASRLTPVPMTDVVVTDGFWAHYQALNRDAIIPHCLQSLERVGWLDNIRQAASGDAGVQHEGPVFADSEVYKTIEAITWEDARSPDPGLRDTADGLAALVDRAQQPDGYIGTAFGYAGTPARYSDLAHGHELYCLGHLIQAGVAALRSGGPPSLGGAARRAADHICRTFGSGGLEGIDGHPEIETALVELYRATGEERYLAQAKLFVDRRGHRTLPDTPFGGRGYYQDDVPVREAQVLSGHAVRALYLAAGALDVALETGDADLLDAVRAQYDRTLQRRTYLTGGMGVYHHGEAFGADYELPSSRAYAETCAAVASIHVAWRLLLATGEPRYADVIERTLYNAVIASPARDGRSFFYVNTLRRIAKATAPEVGVPSLRRTDGRRASWFTTSCCPTNLARTFASLTGYFATVDDDGLQLHQYGTGTIDTTFGKSRRVRLAIRTDYPVGGVVAVRVEQTDAARWSFTLRVPEWAASATVVQRGRTSVVGPGLVTLERRWHAGDEVELRLDMHPRIVHADPRIDDTRDSVAVERGPFVYALESVDQPDLDLARVTIDPDAPPQDGAYPTGLGDVVAVSASGALLDLDADGPPYRSTPTRRATRRAALTLVPYYCWANRGPSTMRVWIPIARPSL